MSKIRIKNFGPIHKGLVENGGWMEISKVTLFIGDQGSGKSTIAKIISTLTWLEKAINRGDEHSPQSIHDFKEYFNYQNIKDYFREDTVIEYDGDLYLIKFNKEISPYPQITKKETKGYIVPKIMYVPAERNFLSVIKNANNVKGLPSPLFDFAEELKRSQHELKGNEIDLSINDVKYKYDKDTDNSFLIGRNYQINLLNASSGYQSIVPLFLVSYSLANLINKGTETDPTNISVEQSMRMKEEIGDIMLGSLPSNEKLTLVDKVKSRYQNKIFINIVEEPEQNLYPNSQQSILNTLLEYNNLNAGNKLIITTHSPYLINYLTLTVKGYDIHQKIKNLSESRDLLGELNKIVPLKSLTENKGVIIYQLDTQGKVIRLSDYLGLPSDENNLNEILGDFNESFVKLLEIEDKCR